MGYSPHFVCVCAKARSGQILLMNDLTCKNHRLCEWVCLGVWVGVGGCGCVCVTKRICFTHAAHLFSFVYNLFLLLFFHCYVVQSYFVSPAFCISKLLPVTVSIGRMVNHLHGPFRYCPSTQDPALVLPFPFLPILSDSLFTELVLSSSYCLQKEWMQWNCDENKSRPECPKLLSLLCVGDVAFFFFWSFHCCSVILSLSGRQKMVRGLLSSF